MRGLQGGEGCLFVHDGSLPLLINRLTLACSASCCILLSLLEELDRGFSAILLGIDEDYCCNTPFLVHGSQGHRDAATLLLLIYQTVLQSIWQLESQDGGGPQGTGPQALDSPALNEESHDQHLRR